MKKRVIIYTIVIVLFLISIVLLGTYAYFSANINSNNATYINTTTASGSYNLLVTNTGTLTHSFNIEKMMESSVGSTPVANGNSNIEVKLLSPDNASRTICTYDLVWEWKSTDQYTTSDAVLPLNDNGTIYNYEMSVKATSTTTGSPSGVDYGNDNTLNETDLSSYTWNGTSGQAGYKTTIHSNAAIISESSTTPTVTKWNVSSYIYNLPVSQAKIFNKTFKADIKVNNLNCNVVSKPITQIVSGNLDTNGSEVAIGSEHFYVLGEDETNSSNVKLLAKYNLSVGIYCNGIIQSNGRECGIAQTGSILYMEPYKEQIFNLYGVNVVTARMISNEEVYMVIDNNWQLGRYGTWTNIVEDGKCMRLVTGGLSAAQYCNGLYSGIRPVIIVSKSIFN